MNHYPEPISRTPSPAPPLAIFLPQVWGASCGQKYVSSHTRAPRKPTTLDPRTLCPKVTHCGLYPRITNFCPQMSSQLWDPQTRCPKIHCGLYPRITDDNLLAGVEPAVGQHPTRQLHKRTGRAQHRPVLRTRGAFRLGPVPDAHQAALCNSAPGDAHARSDLRLLRWYREHLLRRCGAGDDGATADPRATGVCSKKGCRGGVRPAVG